MYNRVLNFLHSSIAKVLIVLMSVMLINVTWQVVSRLVLNNPSSFTEELALYLMIWISILGASYAYRTRAHLGLDIVTGKLNSQKKAIVDIIAQLFCIVFAIAVMVYGGANLVQLTLSLNQLSPALGLKVGYIYSVIPISGVLITLYAIDNIGNDIELLRQNSLNN